jgi:hypothetical protein
MAQKQQINIIVENTVAQGATVTNESAIIPNGKTIMVTKFGGYERVQSVSTGIIALQIGSGAAWTTIRVGGGGAPFEFDLQRTFVGDGIKKFRIVRINKDPAASSPKEMAAWIEAVVL